MLERPLQRISRAWCWCGLEGAFFNYGPEINIRDRHQMKAERRAENMPVRAEQTAEQVMQRAGRIR